jgi:hypothetical protein
VIVGVAPFGWAALHAWFWQERHSMAPVATALYPAVVLALVVWRRRWSWLLLVLLYGAGVVTWAFDQHLFAAAHVLGFVAGGRHPRATALRSDAAATAASRLGSKRF